jgi:hypothetical protein
METDHKFQFVLINAIFRDAVASSVMHNRLYLNGNTLETEKGKVKQEWLKLLCQRSLKYKTKIISKKDYFDDVEEIKDAMNMEFSEIINFQYSHAQKSMSIFLKHLWCIERINEPPSCPIDSIVLKAAGLGNERWTQIHTKEKFIELFERIEDHAHMNSKSIAQWELEEFHKLQNA